MEWPRRFRPTRNGLVSKQPARKRSHMKELLCDRNAISLKSDWCSLVLYTTEDMHSVLLHALETDTRIVEPSSSFGLLSMEWMKEWMNGMNRWITVIAHSRNARRRGEREREMEKLTIRCCYSLLRYYRVVRWRDGGGSAQKVAIYGLCPRCGYGISLFNEWKSWRLVFERPFASHNTCQNNPNIQRLNLHALCILWDFQTERSTTKMIRSRLK